MKKDYEELTSRGRIENEWAENSHIPETEKKIKFLEIEN